MSLGSSCLEPNKFVAIHFFKCQCYWQSPAVVQHPPAGIGKFFSAFQSDFDGLRKIKLIFRSFFKMEINS